MATLFNETKNPVFRVLCKLVNEIHDGAKLTRQEIQSRIKSVAEFNYDEAPENNKENEIIDKVFKFPEGFATVCIDESIPIIAGKSELMWLKTLLEDSEVTFLLDEELRQKLSGRLKDFKPLYDAQEWIKTRPNDFAVKNRQENLSAIVTALREGKKIFRGEDLLTPCKLQYDLFTDEYSLIIWHDEDNRAEKISVNEDDKFTLSAEKIADDTENKLQDFYRQHSAKISLRLINKRNAVERCFELFAAYDKEARAEEGGEYFLTVTYCDFDEEEIINKIFLLGSAVNVLEPENIRQQVINHFLAIKKLYA